MRATARLGSAGRTIVGVSIVSVCSVAPASCRRRSIVWRASGVQSRLVEISTSAAISDLASLPKTPRTLWMTERSATIAATPTAMQTKKNSSRRHDDARLADGHAQHEHHTTLPSRSVMRASATAASSASCVTSTSVVPRVR